MVAETPTAQPLVGTRLPAMILLGAAPLRLATRQVEMEAEADHPMAHLRRRRRRPSRTVWAMVRLTQLTSLAVLGTSLTTTFRAENV